MYKRQGQGTLNWQGGDKYEGDWKDGKRAGQGTLNYSDGSMYQGEWLDGTLNGLGTFTSFDGRKWVGEFRKDEPWNITWYDNQGNIIAKWGNGVKIK